VPAAWDPAGAPEPARTSNPWLVVLTVGLAVVVLVLVAVGLRAAGGRNRSGDVVEVPARRDSVPPTTDPSSASPSTRIPGSSSTTAPATGTRGTSTTVPKLDTATPRIRVTDTEGRFGVTVPRTWLNLPALVPDQNQWVPLAQLPTGELGRSPFTFVVRWAASDGCALEACADQVVNRLMSNSALIANTSVTERIGGRPAIRIDAATAAERVVAWVVVEGDRVWIPQLRGPATDFDTALAVVRPVVASMSFG